MTSHLTVLPRRDPPTRGSSRASQRGAQLSPVPAPPDREEARRAAWAIIMRAAEEALMIPGLPEETRSRLARIHRAARRAAGRPILRFADDNGAS